MAPWGVIGDCREGVAMSCVNLFMKPGDARLKGPDRLSQVLASKHTMPLRHGQEPDREYC
jgi:hypothetical protein